MDTVANLGDCRNYTHAVCKSSPLAAATPVGGSLAGYDRNPTALHLLITSSFSSFFFLLSSLFFYLTSATAKVGTKKANGIRFILFSPSLVYLYPHIHFSCRYVFYDWVVLIRWVFAFVCLAQSVVFIMRCVGMQCKWNGMGGDIALSDRLYISLYQLSNLFWVSP